MSSGGGVSVASALVTIPFIALTIDNASPWIFAPTRFLALIAIDAFFPAQQSALVAPSASPAASPATDRRPDQVRNAGWRPRPKCEMPSRTAPPGAKERLIMGRVTGDKSRFNKQRRQKIAKREDMRALRKSWAEKAAATPKTQSAS